MHEYKCKILRIVDGDTVDVDVDLGFGIWMHKERVRLLGIDTPESRTRDKEEKRFGLLSKKYLQNHYPSWYSEEDVKYAKMIKKKLKNVKQSETESKQ